LFKREISHVGRRIGAVGAAAAMLVAGAGLVATTAEAAPSAALVRVGAAPTVPRGSTLIAAPAADQKLGLSVTLKPRNEAALAGFVQAVSTPGSLEYHRYLTKGQFAGMFGPTQATITATEAALRAKGLTVGSVTPDGLTISVSTTVAGAEAAFATGFNGYKLANGKTAYANTSAPQLSGSVAANLVGVVGLDDLATPTSNIVSSNHPVRVAAASVTGSVKSNAVKPAYSAPQVCSGVTQTFNGQGYYDGQGYYSAAALSSVYGTSSELAAGDNGTGVSVGVFELEGIDLTGVSAYESCLGLTTPVTVEKVDGGSSIPVDGANNVGVETALDVETIASMAPGVSIIDYEGPDAATSTDAQVLATYQKMVTDDTVKVISSSWGECELDSVSATIASENLIFEEAAAYGQSVVAASGDQGSTACYGDGVTASAAQLSVSDPAAQPDVLGVGGTSMQGLNTPSSLSAWNSDGDATGGGVSKIWSLADGGFQSGFQGAGYSNACSAAVGAVCRQVPDVSALADPNEGYIIWVYFSAGPDGPGEYFTTEGGTSGAAPVWASILALADASKDCAANGPVGMVSPALYTAAKAGTSGVLTDVTVGDNISPSSGYTGSDYQAGTGYDLTTGLGTPLAGGVTKVACAAAVASAAGYYVPFGPVRILDTRSNIGLNGKLAAYATDQVQVAGVDGIPSDITSVVMNVTATGALGNGFITAFPTGAKTVPNASNVNFTKGGTVPNLVVVPVGTGGKVSLYNGGDATGATDLVADVSGYFVSSSATAGASTFTTLPPVRVIDTRTTLNGITGKIPVNGTDVLKIAGLSGVPNDATAVVANVTATGALGSGFITVYPNGESVPNASNVNFVKGQTVPNLTIVPVGTNGSIDFTNGGQQTGPTDLVVDISGYFTAGTAGDVFHVSSPARILDTRFGIGVGSVAKIGTNGTLQMSLGDPGSTLASADAVIANLTVTNPQGAGFITAYPSSITTVPNASNVNFAKAETVPNLAIISNTTGTIDFTNGGQQTGPTDLLVDVSGYFSAS
jgi:hypothetical protein